MTIGVVLAVLLLVLPGLSGKPPGWIPLFVAWGLLNGGLAIGGGVWGLLHPRAVLAGRGLILRWALWTALLVSFWLPFFVADGLARLTGLSVSSGLLLIVAVVVFVLCLLSALLLGVQMAATGAWAARNVPVESRWLAPGAAVATGGIVLLLSAMVAAARIPHVSPVMSPMLLMAAPGAGCLVGRAAALRRLGPLTSLEHLSIWLERRLMLAGSVDLRGQLLGLLAVVPVYVLGYGQFFAPLQAAALIGIVRVRNQPVISRELPQSLALREQPALQQAKEQIVLLQMDPVTRHRIFSNASEAAVQAEMIGRLKVLGARLIVLPVPQLHPLEDTIGRARWDSPLPGEGETKRTRRDLPRLEKAVRAAGMVLLSVPDARDALLRFGMNAGPDAQPSRREVASLDPQREVPGLFAAAKGAGTEMLGAMGDARLPTLGVGAPGKTLQSIAWKVAEAIRPVRVPERALLQPGFSWGGRLSGANTSMSREVLVDVRSAQPGRSFASLDYRAVLDGAPVFRRPPITDEANDPPPGRWIPAAEFFRGKIVFLEPVTPFTQETAVGTMQRSEVMAHATAMLLSGSMVEPLSRPLLLLGIGLLGLLAGGLCNRCGPTLALTRAGVLALLVVIAAPVALSFENIWFDPVLPLLSIGSVLAVVVQMTFAAERRDRQRIGSIMERYLPPALLQRFMAPDHDTERSLALLGDRRKVCVLFADTRNFTPFAERNSPEVVVATTNRYLTAMAEALFDYGGILDKFTGDGLMAFFLVDTPSDASEEVVVDLERQTVRQGVRAAVAMRDAVEKVSAEIHAEGGETLQIGLGLHFGPAVVGLVGSPKRPDYTALGYAVVVSHRLQGLAAGGEIVISEAVHLATREEFRSEAGEPVRIKGLSELVTPYRVLSAEGTSTPMQVDDQTPARR